jgi:hypothetical protein
MTMAINANIGSINVEKYDVEELIRFCARRKVEEVQINIGEESEYGLEMFELTVNGYSRKRRVVKVDFISDGGFDPASWAEMERWGVKLCAALLEAGIPAVVSE